MKHLLKAALAVAVAAVSMSAHSNAQTVAVDGLGSSGLFLELGLGASSSLGSIKATCVWSENTNSVIATDSSVTPSLQDKGSAWAAWTTGTGGTCAAPTSTSTIYGYLQTDSVVGNRCLFNANLTTAKCSIAYPTTNPASAGLILGTAGEVALPVAVANKLNAAKVNAAGTDIRPEDAEFAIARALTSCGTPVATGSQYLGLGYTNGGQIDSEFSSSVFNVINFTLPASFSVTPVGATPVVFVVNGNGDTTGFSNPSITNITSQTLANFLDGTYSYTQQVLSATGMGDSAKVLIREPLSGTYNTVEYNVTNTTTAKTSQDVGVNQLAAQKNCSGTVPLSNPMNIATLSGGARQRAIGTGQELAQVIANPNSLGYSFWSVANFAGFTNTAAPFAKYLKVDGIDPLLKSTATYNGTIPLTGSTNLANVDLHTTAQGTYPVWSLLRLVNFGSSPLAAVTSLASSAQAFVSFGTTTSRPDFITPSTLKVVRSHFIPPAGTIQPTTAANGHVGLASSACTAAEAGGDVGGVVYTLTADSAYCTAHGVTTGQTGQRR